MEKTINDSVAIYKEQLSTSDIQKTYEFLMRYMMKIKESFKKNYSEKYSCGSVSPGYMDFTYFPFSDNYLHETKLRFGIVLNHKELQFELWLMGRNAEIQKEYWELLKTSTWNKNQTSMPKYSVLEAVLVDNPDFDNINELTAQISSAADELAQEIIEYIVQIKQ